PPVVRSPPPAGPCVTPLPARPPPHHPALPPRPHQPWPGERPRRRPRTREIPRSSGGTLGHPRRPVGTDGARRARARGPCHGVRSLATTLAACTSDHRRAVRRGPRTGGRRRGSLPAPAAHDRAIRAAPALASRAGRRADRRDLRVGALSPPLRRAHLLRLPRPRTARRRGMVRRHARTALPAEAPERPTAPARTQRD